MKTSILLLMLFGGLSATAQMTHNLNWFSGIGTDVDLKIGAGDTVIWTWTDAAQHSVASDVGSAENFDSFFKTGVGQTYTKTFTVVGTNPYFCRRHGAASMSGTITVNAPLGIDDFALKHFKIFPNPAHSVLQLQLPEGIYQAKVQVYGLLGKQVFANSISNAITDSEINISLWNVGVYLVKVSAENKTHTKRFIKQ